MFIVLRNFTKQLCRCFFAPTLPARGAGILFCPGVLTLRQNNDSPGPEIFFHNGNTIKNDRKHIYFCIRLVYRSTSPGNICTSPGNIGI